MKRSSLIRFIRYVITGIVIFVLFWFLFNSPTFVGYWYRALYENPLYNDGLIFIYVQHFWLGLLILGCTMFIVWEIRKHKDD